MIANRGEVSQGALRKLVSRKFLESCSDIAHSGARSNRTLRNRYLNYIVLRNKRFVVLTHGSWRVSYPYNVG